MASTDIAITQGWSDGTALTESQLDTAMSDIETWLNARNNGTDEWKNINIASTDADPLEVRSSNNNTTSIIIDNTGTGDPGLDFQLSGSSIHKIFVDDSDSDYLKFSASGGGGVGMQMLAGATARVEFKDGSAITPSRGFIGSVQTGPYLSGSNDYGISIFGTGQLKVTNGTIEPITDNDVSNGTASKRWSDVRAVLINGADIGFANGYIMREFPCTEEDVQTKTDEWMKENANAGIQILNDAKEVVAVIGRGGTIYAKAFAPLSNIL